METVKLSAKTREVFGKKMNIEREKGMLPCIVYGKGLETRNIWVKKLDFLRLIKETGESTMIELSVDSKEKNKVLIYETQKNPVTSEFIHVDFFQVRMDEKIETEVELNYIGEAPAVKELGGILVKNMDKIGVECLPADLPSEIKVDISGLKDFDSHICVKDLEISSKVKVDIDLETVVALVTPPRSEEELEGLSEKVEEDVTKVEGVEKEPEKEDDVEIEKEEDKKEIKKEKK
jgi:large subunit ribosomal protein L25